MYDLYMGRHVVLTRELLKAEGAWIHLDVAFVRGNIMTTEVADMCIHP